MAFFSLLGSHSTVTIINKHVLDHLSLLLYTCLFITVYYHSSWGVSVFFVCLCSYFVVVASYLNAVVSKDANFLFVSSNISLFSVKIDVMKNRCALGSVCSFRKSFNPNTFSFIAAILQCACLPFFYFCLFFNYKVPS